MAISEWWRPTRLQQRWSQPWAEMGDKPGVRLEKNLKKAGEDERVFEKREKLRE